MKLISVVSFQEVDACDIAFEYGTYALVLTTLLWAWQRRKVGQFTVALLFGLTAELGFNLGSDEPPSFGREESISTIMVLRDYLSFHRLLLWGVVAFASDQAVPACYLSSTFFPRLLGALLFSAALYPALVPAEACTSLGLLAGAWERSLVVQSSYTLGLGAFEAIHTKMCEELPGLVYPLVVVMQFLYVALVAVGHLILGDSRARAFAVGAVLVATGVHWAWNKHIRQEEEKEKEYRSVAEVNVRGNTINYKKEGDEEEMRCDGRNGVLLLMAVVVGWYALGIIADERKEYDAIFYTGFGCSVLFVAMGALINRPKNEKQTEKKKKKKND